MVTQDKLDLTVGACIVFEDKVLLMLHAKLNKWLFPGGHIDLNEHPDQALSREVKEETGLDLIFLQYSDLNQDEDEILKLAIPFYANVHSVGDHDHYGAYYLCTVRDNCVISNNESQELKWFTKEEIDNLNNLPKSIEKMAIKALDLLRK